MPPRHRIAWAVLAATLVVAGESRAQVDACTEDIILRSATCPVGSSDCSTKGATLSWLELDGSLVNLAGLCSARDANAILAGPTTGADARPVWRALVAADIPTPLTSNTSGNAATATTAAAGDSATSFFAAGTIEPERIGSGTPGPGNFLRGDSAWTALAAIATSGSASDLSAGTVPSSRLGTGGEGAGAKALADNQTFVTLPTGDVVGPSSSIDYELGLFDSTTGKLLKRVAGLKADANGRLYVPDGTSSGFFLGDSNTGWYEAANNQPTLRIAGTDAVDFADLGGGSYTMRFFGGRGIRLTGTASSSKQLGDGTSFLTFEGGNGQAWFVEGAAGASHQVATIQGDFTGRSRGIRSYESVYVRTADTSLAATDSASLLTNEGASGTVILTLPTAASGLHFRAYVQTAQILRLKANTGDTIRLGASVSASAGFIQNATVGGYIEVHAINTTEWIAGPPVGTWTIDS